MSQPNVERHPLASNKRDFVFQFSASQIYGHLQRVSIRIVLICEFKIWRLAYFTLVSLYIWPFEQKSIPIPITID